MTEQSVLVASGEEAAVVTASRRHDDESYPTSAVDQPDRPGAAVAARELTRRSDTTKASPAHHPVSTARAAESSTARHLARCQQAG